MKHLNGNILCAIDLETTGLVPGHNEIIQIAIVPLNSQFEPLAGIAPFYMHVLPLHWERWTMDAQRVTGLSRPKLSKIGIDRYSAIDLLLDWHDQLPLHVTKWGTRKKLQPLGHNFAAFDRSFLIDWLGYEQYEELFDYHVRDTIVLANYINDRAAVRGEKVPFPEISLSYISKVLGIEKTNMHDAMDDSLLSAKVYKKLLQYQFGLFS